MRWRVLMLALPVWWYAFAFAFAFAVAFAPELHHVKGAL
jgi:hypothetical protein